VADPARLSRMGFKWNMTLDTGVGGFVDWFRDTVAR
jgi:hypothetical protein